jgi:uncharacterized membrane protein
MIHSFRRQRQKFSGHMHIGALPLLLPLNFFPKGLVHLCLVVAKILRDRLRFNRVKLVPLIALNCVLLFVNSARTVGAPVLDYSFDM